MTSSKVRTELSLPLPGNLGSVHCNWSLVPGFLDSVHGNLDLVPGNINFLLENVNLPMTKFEVAK